MTGRDPPDSDRPVGSTVGSDDDPDGIDSYTSDDATPVFSAARTHLLIELLRFARILRRDGVSVPASGSLDAARALAVVGLDDKAAVGTALRASLLSDPADSAAFEEAFPTFWHRLRSGFDRIATAHDGPGADASDDEESDGTDGDDAETADRLPDAEAPSMDGEGDGDVSVRIPTERRHVSDDRPADTGESDSRRYSTVGEGQPVESTGAFLEDFEPIEQFLDALGVLPGRRRRRSHRETSMVDARTALRESLSTGGTPLELPYAEPIESELRCCLLVDVSGSVLDTIDRGGLLALADRLVKRAWSARVFLFDTDLVEATEAFSSAETGRDPATALRNAEITWGGGTKIGNAFGTLRRTAPDAVDRRTVVIVVSDGLDVGEPAELTEGITWLSNRARTVVWLNPLAASQAFEPTSRGMEAVLPYVDALFGFGTASDLADAARQLERFGPAGPVGYEHDHRRTDVGWSNG